MHHTLLRHDPTRAPRAAYAATKTGCLAAHPDDHAAYGACKSALIDRLEPLALSESARP